MDFEPAVQTLSSAKEGVVRSAQIVSDGQKQLSGLSFGELYSANRTLIIGLGVVIIILIVLIIYLSMKKKKQPGPPMHPNNMGQGGRPPPPNQQYPRDNYQRGPPNQNPNDTSNVSVDDLMNAERDLENSNNVPTQGNGNFNQPPPRYESDILSKIPPASSVPQL